MLNFINFGFREGFGQYFQFVDLSSDFDFASRHMTVRILTDSDEEPEIILIYDKQGTVGDFIREVRRVLKILPYEKVSITLF